MKKPKQASRQESVKELKILLDQKTAELELKNRELEVEVVLENVRARMLKIKHSDELAETTTVMYQHSRTGDVVKKPTDLNALADEYVRLAYHGLRAKDKSFNADFKTDFEESLPKVNVIAQDIGRVLLNLINNAFYACTERSRSADSDYQPMVEVSTKTVLDKIEISVKDNGDGIPEQVRDKIFQPFFTTKPTGSGTGLGLSLAYDIIKAHGGELKVQSKEGEGSEFEITFPIV